MTVSSTAVAIALGSNLGDRESHLRFAIGHLRDYVTGLCQSSVIETEPQGVTAGQPLFLNAVVTGRTTLRPRPLLAVLLDLEQQRQRERPYRGAPRTLDLDLILYGRETVGEPDLIVPHPRFRERRFVLAPLAEIAGSWVDPATGLSVSALLRRLGPF